MKPEDYTKLPEPVKLEDTVAEHDVRPVPDPEAGRNTEQDFAVKYSGG
ncbi:MAG: hypothetical protein J7518_06675 [Nocardioidaceae bacterium]|nr:hypothetical protein [Nocardioidaceae bacterium]